MKRQIQYCIARLDAFHSGKTRLDTLNPPYDKDTDVINPPLDEPTHAFNPQYEADLPDKARVFVAEMQALFDTENPKPSQVFSRDIQVQLEAIVQRHIGPWRDVTPETIQSTLCQPIHRVVFANDGSIRYHTLFEVLVFGAISKSLAESGRDFRFIQSRLGPKGLIDIMTFTSNNDAFFLLLGFVNEFRLGGRELNEAGKSKVVKDFMGFIKHYLRQQDIDVLLREFRSTMPRDFARFLSYY
jgi:hypothetical protein